MWAGIEDARLKAHFAEVMDELRARDVSGFAPAKQAARAAIIDELGRYAARGVFPRNRDFPDGLVPYFVDARGVTCAVAHLMEATGETALEAAISQRYNNAYVREFAAEPGVAEWLERVGLDVAEAARIQPEYCLLVYMCVCMEVPPAFAEAIPVGHDDQGIVDVQVTEVHGDERWVTVGDTLKIYPTDVEAPSFIVPVFPYVAVTNNPGSVRDGRVELRCGFGSIENVASADLIAAWDSSDCQATMLERDPATAKSTCDEIAPDDGPENGESVEVEVLEGAEVEAAESPMVEAGSGTQVVSGDGCGAGATSAVGLLGLALRRRRKAA